MPGGIFSETLRRLKKDRDVTDLFCSFFFSPLRHPPACRPLRLTKNETPALLALMGQDWKEEPVPADWHGADRHAELVRRDGLRLSLTFGGGWRMGTRLRVSAGHRSTQGCNTSLRDYVPYDERDRLPTSITLALDKPPRKVAAEISRRMLAKLNPAAGNANEADERARQQKESRAAWQARFIAVSGGQLEHAYHEKNALRSKQGRDVEIKRPAGGNPAAVSPWGLKRGGFPAH